MRREAAQLVFGCASVLLSYPDEGFVEDLAGVRDGTGRLPAGRARTCLTGAVEWLAAATRMEAARRYVETFDLAKKRTLHLTYYRHGDTRERGLALAALADAYRAAGVRLRPGELPDLLPALLEVAAVSSVGAAVLAEHRGALDALRSDLDDARSGYAPVVEAVAGALGPASRADQAALRRYRAAGPPSERVGLEPFAPPEVLGHGLGTR